MNFWVWKHRIWCQHWFCRSWMAKNHCFLYFCNILWFLKRLLIPNLFEEIVTRLGNVVEFNHFVWICAKMRISEWSELRPGPLRTLQLPLINQSEAVLDPQSVKGLNRSSIGRRGWVRKVSHLNTFSLCTVVCMTHTCGRLWLYRNKFFKINIFFWTQPHPDSELE